MKLFKDIKFERKQVVKGVLCVAAFVLVSLVIFLTAGKSIMAWVSE